ncbi:MAG: type II secretion system protein GspD, partial [Candidatus Muiribacteriaceae bacterium]
EREAHSDNGYEGVDMASDTISVSEPDQDKDSGASNINFNFSGMSLKEIFETLSNLTGYNIILDGGVKEKEMNLFIQDLALNEALDLVVTSAGLSKHRFNGNTFIITEKERARDMLARKEQRMFKLSNAEADEVISLIQGNKILADKIKRENLSADERINAILAYDTPENLALIEKIIGDFDKKNGQVTIELHLVEMKREDLNNFGFTYDQFPISPKSMDLMNLPSSVKIYTKLEALVSEEKANILSSPKIRVVHKKPAKIRIGDEIPVPYFTYEEAHKYVNTQSSRDNDVRVVEPLKKFTRADVGIDLKVTPYIHDNNEVSMDLDVSISDLIKVDNDGQLYTSSRDTQTFVRLKDRETAVLGGLIKQEERNEESRVPGFQRIPILRHLFKNRKKTKKNMEMLMFITPYFVNKDKEPEKIADKSRETDIDRKTTPDTDREYYNVIGELKKISD